MGNRVARPEGAGPRAGPVAMATGNSFREARPRDRHARVHPVVRMRTLRAQPGAASDGRGGGRACAGPSSAARQNGGGCWRGAVCVFIYLYVRVPRSSRGCAKVLCSCFFFFSFFKFLLFSLLPGLLCMCVPHLRVPQCCDPFIEQITNGMCWGGSGNKSILLHARSLFGCVSCLSCSQVFEQEIEIQCILFFFL